MRYIFPLAAILVLPAAVHAQTQDPVKAVVQALDDGLLSIMKSGKTAGVAGRSASPAGIFRSRRQGGPVLRYRDAGRLGANPGPPIRLTSRRNEPFVTSAIGASTTGGAIRCVPMR